MLSEQKTGILTGEAERFPLRPTSTVRLPMKSSAQEPRHRPAEGSRTGAHSLAELLVVLAVVSLLLAFAAPGLVALAPSRKAGLHRLAGFLEHARAQAIAAREERIVAFADETFPTTAEALRAYALFAPMEAEGASSEQRPLRRLTPWRTLPEGLVFARGESFEREDGVTFRTLHDLARARSIPVPGADGRDGVSLPLPCLVFGPDGGIRWPDFANADALHLGIVEGFLDSASGRLVPTSGRSGDCLGIGCYTGRVRTLTD